MIPLILLLCQWSIFSYVIIYGSMDTSWPLYSLLVLQPLSLLLQAKIWTEAGSLKTNKIRCFLLYGTMAATWWAMIVYPESHRIHSYTDLAGPVSGVFIFGGLAGWLAVKYLNFVTRGRG